MVMKFAFTMKLNRVEPVSYTHLQIMDTQIIGWKRGGYHRFTSEGYGRQRCWTRKSEEIEGGNEIGENGFRELSATEQMELPFH